MSEQGPPGAKPIPPRAPAPGFGATLADHLARRRLSQAKLAVRIGCEHSYVSRIITGSRSPSRETVTAIVDALDLGQEDRLRLLVLALVPEDDQPDLLEAISLVPLAVRYRDATQLVAAIDAVMQEARG